MVKIILLHSREAVTFLIVVQLEQKNNVEKNFYRLAGFPGNPSDHILITLADTMESHASPHAWDSISMVAVHKFIIDNFDEIESGDSLDEQLIFHAEQERCSKTIKEEVELGFSGLRKAFVDAQSTAMARDVFNEAMVKTVFNDLEKNKPSDPHMYEHSREMALRAHEKTIFDFHEEAETAKETEKTIIFSESIEDDEESIETFPEKI